MLRYLAGKEESGSNGSIRFTEMSLAEVHACHKNHVAKYFSTMVKGLGFDNGQRVRPDSTMTNLIGSRCEKLSFVLLALLLSANGIWFNILNRVKQQMNKEGREGGRD